MTFSPGKILEEWDNFSWFQSTQPQFNFSSILERRDSKHKQFTICLSDTKNDQKDIHTSWSSETWCCFKFSPSLSMTSSIQFKNQLFWLLSSFFCVAWWEWWSETNDEMSETWWMKLDVLMSSLEQSIINFRVFNPNQTEHLSIQEWESWEMRLEVMMSWVKSSGVMLTQFRILRMDDLRSEWWGWWVDELVGRSDCPLTFLIWTSALWPSCPWPFTVRTLLLQSILPNSKIHLHL